MMSLGRLLFALVILTLVSERANGDGLLDPLNLFSRGETSDDAARKSREPRTAPRPTSFGKTAEPESSQLWSLPRFDLFARSQVRNVGSSLDRSVRQSWANTRAYGRHAGQAASQTAGQFNHFATATYQRTADALSPQKNLVRMRRFSDEVRHRLTMPFVTYATPDGRPPRQAWADRPARSSAPEEDGTRSDGWLQLPRLHGE